MTAAGLLAAGAVSALAFIWFARQRGPGGEISYYASGLIVAASIYLGFAAGAGSLPRITIELFGVAAFSGLALLGLRQSTVILAIGWIVHVAWDVFLHLRGEPTNVPFWYPTLCVSFDLVVGAYLFRLTALRAR